MNIEDLLREAGREARSEQASSEVEQHLVDAFRKQHRRRSLPVWAAAAVAVIAIFSLWRLSLQKHQQPQEFAAQVIEENTAFAEQSPPELATEMPPEEVIRPQRKRNISAKPTIHREIRSGFYALDAGVLSEEIDGYVVRVRVPKATMASFGLPVQPDMGDSRIDADLLVGGDGTARAIRFVQVIQ